MKTLERTLLVLGPEGDPAAAAMAAAWPGEVAAASLRDLSRPGWSLVVGNAEHTTLSVNGRRFGAAELGGAICRLGWIQPEALDWIDAEERDYVAAEMAAFLLAFFDQLPCPMLNRPTPACLAGALPRPPAWRAAARLAGFALAPADALPEWRIDLIGENCFGTTDPVLIRRAQALATTLDCGLLSLAMTGTVQAPRFITAHPFVDLGHPVLAAAAAQQLQARQAS